MTYARVVPRDLFNEGNLLKCLGRLYLKTEASPVVSIHNPHAPEGFDIRQDPADGSIYCHNVNIKIGGTVYCHRRPLNSREPWPLYLTPMADPDGDEIEVFNARGDLTREFKALLA